MSGAGATSANAWQDAMLAARLFALDPFGCGGIHLRAHPGPVRDRFLALAQAMLPAGAPVRHVPSHAAVERLLGGLDLPATLGAGRPVAARGLLAEADGGAIVLRMAERAERGTVAHLCAALDSGALALERDGLARRYGARFGVIALDEAIGEEEGVAGALLDRLAFPVDLRGIGLTDLDEADVPEADFAMAHARRCRAQVGNEVLEALAAAALALGIASLRAPMLAVRAARLSAALAGREAAIEADAVTAARLVLAPRATVLPGEKEAQPSPEEPAEAEDERADAATGDAPLADVVLEAARAALPDGLLEQLRAGALALSRNGAGGRAGARRVSVRRGRPAGTTARHAPGARLDLVATLRAAAPWQKLRGAAGRIEVRPDDFRFIRTKQRTETAAIFAVDASGSAALHRLAEAKGAVELLLADCYIRRDQVALLAFRGRGAEVILPPTRSLVRAKRALAGLPGGGATPLAAGIESAFALADAARRRGQTPLVVLLTDGRANIARDGGQGRVQAEADAVAAGRRLRGSGIDALLVDTAPRAQPFPRRLADEMGARYLPLPFANADTLSRAVSAAAAGAS